MKYRILRIFAIVVLVLSPGIWIMSKKVVDARNEEIDVLLIPARIRSHPAPINNSPDPAEVEYRPGGKAFAAVWEKFYSGNHEPDIDDPLIAAGSKMVPEITEAIANRDMRLRRYAISALGYIGDKRALLMLGDILKDKTEKDYFRGDALRAIYLIDEKLGKDCAVLYAEEKNAVGSIGAAIKSNEAWLKEPTEE